MLRYQCNGNADLVQEVCQAKKMHCVTCSPGKRHHTQATTTGEELLHLLLPRICHVQNQEKLTNISKNS